MSKNESKQPYSPSVMSEAGLPEPVLSLRIGVTGHRPNKLYSYDMEMLQRQCNLVVSAALTAMNDFFRDCSSQSKSYPYRSDIDPNVSITTCLAEGADTILARIGKEKKLGLSYILPRKYDEYRLSLELEHRDTFDGFWNDEAKNASKTELASTFHSIKGEEYLSAGYMLLSHTDLLVAIWDGEAADGLGGTEEIVEEALRRGIFVVRVSPDGKLFTWSGSAYTGSAGSVEMYKSANWQVLHNRDEEIVQRFSQWIQAKFSPPSARSSGESRSSSGKIARLLGTLALFFVNTNGSASDSEGSWARIEDTLKTLSGSDYAEGVKTAIETRMRVVDRLATQYGSVYRAATIINFLLAALAVAVGLLVLVVGNATSTKAMLVGVEVAILSIILVITSNGLREKWHEQWLGYRYLAEGLRAARLASLVGSVQVGLSKPQSHRNSSSWPEWYLNACMREVRPPTAVIDDNALRSAISSMINDELKPQIEYHRGKAKRAHTLDHLLELVSGVLVWGTIFVLVAFLVVYFFDRFGVSSGLSYLLKPWVTFVGGTLPVFGASIFAIRSTGSFRSIGAQSEQTQERLKLLCADLRREFEEPSLLRIRSFVGEIEAALHDDLGRWISTYEFQELEAGF